MDADVVIVGAGVAGLSCAAEVAAGGGRPLVLERSRGVGGRCATRRVDGRPVDHGVAFLHGRDPAFLARLRAVSGGGRLEGWPWRVEGAGLPCHPDSFRPGEQRLAYRAGVSSFPKDLARGLDLRLGVTVTALEVASGGVAARLADGARVTAPSLVLALATEQSLPLLTALGAAAGPEVAAAGRLLAMVAATVPSLTLLCGYERGAPPPLWDVAYPDSTVLQLAIHDSAKRDDGGPPVLVFQARPRWSRGHLEAEPAAWTPPLLAAAAELLGPWAARPAWVQAHRWRYARVSPGDELTAPLLLPLPGGGRLGVTGEAFALGGGIEAAWTAGRALARRLLEEERT